MNCLFFDIASHQATFAVVLGEDVLAYLSVDDVVRDDQLPSFVEQVLEEAGITYEDLTNIACVIGPGGFTSLRVAVTYANVLADQLNIPLAGVNLADLYSAQCKDNDAVWIHSTKKTEVFVRGVQKKSDHWSWPEPAHLPLEEAIKTITSPAWCGELIEEHREQIKKKKIKKAKMIPIQNILSKFLKDLTYNKKQIVPWYGRNW